MFSCKEIDPYSDDVTNVVAVGLGGYSRVVLCGFKEPLLINFHGWS